MHDIHNYIVSMHVSMNTTHMWKGGTHGYYLVGGLTRLTTPYLTCNTEQDQQWQENDVLLLSEASQGAPTGWGEGGSARV